MTELSSADFIKDSCTSVALGIFDGVHRGHQTVIRMTIENAAHNGYLPAVCTFRTSSINTKGSDYCPIYSDVTKVRLLAELGAEYVYNPDFSEISKMSAEEFVSVILKDKLNARSVSCGRDFHFGKGAACGVEGLSELCRSYGMELLVTDDVCENGKRISSAEIRSLIRAGRISAVNRLLGHDYAVSGEVINGNQIGRLMNFPTANQKMGEGIVLPKFGVYASYAEIDGRFYKGVTNIGVKPTVEKSSPPLSETFFLEYDGDLYGKSITVRLLEYIRSEQRFADISELKKRISCDIKTAAQMNYPNICL